MPWEKLETSGWCIHTLKAALWALYHTKSFEEGLISIVNRGDDADTCGAVSGALLGAYYGVESIPLKWLNKINRKKDLIKLIDLYKQSL